MYTLRLVERTLRCSLCRAEIAGGGFVGHYYRDPLCGRCFAEAEPRVADAWEALSNGSGESLRLVEDPAADCGSCGEPVASRVGGFSGETLLCRKCLGQRAPQLAAVLVLDIATRKWRAEQGRVVELAALAEAYSAYFEAQ